MKKKFFVTCLIMVASTIPSLAEEFAIECENCDVNTLFEKTIEYIKSNEDVTNDLIEQIEASDELMKTISTVEENLQKPIIKITDELKIKLAKEVTTNEKFTQKALVLLGQSEEYAKFLSQDSLIKEDLSDKILIDNDFAQLFLNSLDKKDINKLQKQ